MVTSARSGSTISPTADVVGGDHAVKRRADGRQRRRTVSRFGGVRPELLQFLVGEAEPVNLFIDAIQRRLLAVDRGLRILELGAAKVEHLLRDGLLADQRFGAFDGALLHGDVAFRLAQSGARLEVLAEALAKLNVVVGQQRLAGLDAVAEPHRDLGDQATRQRPNLGHPRALGRHSAGDLEMDRQRRLAHVRDLDAGVLLRGLWNLDDARRHFLAVLGLVRGRRVRSATDQRPDEAPAHERTEHGRDRQSRRTRAAGW